MLEPHLNTPSATGQEKRTDRKREWRSSSNKVSLEASGRIQIVPLLPIPVDPEPTQAVLQRIIQKRKLRPRAAEVFAKLNWRSERARRDPDAFLVAFQDWIFDWTEWSCSNYRQYLETPLWARIRREVLTEAGYRCAGCGSRATQVHHRDYRPRVLRGEDLTALVALCKDCHENKVHRAPDGAVRHVWQDIELALKTLVEGNESRSPTVLHSR